MTRQFAHRHRPEALQVAGQWVQLETMHIDVLDLLGDVQNTEDVLDLLDVLRIHASSVATFKELFQSLVAETYDHLPSMIW
jgi:hypothetical protein